MCHCQPPPNAVRTREPCMCDEAHRMAAQTQKATIAPATFVFFYHRSEKRRPRTDLSLQPNSLSLFHDCGFLSPTPTPNTNTAHPQRNGDTARHG